MKKLIALIITAIMLFSLVSCGNTPAEPTQTDAPISQPTSEPTEEPTSEPPAVHVHNYAESPMILPTTTSEGRTAGMICVTCGDVQSGGEPIPKLTASADTGAAELKVDFNEFKANLNETRHETMDNFEFPELPDFTPESDIPALTEEEVQLLATEREERSVNKQEAIEDVNAFFNALHDGYSAYYLFGPENFENAREDIIKEIEALPDNAEITPGDIKGMIYERTDKFIRDKHFQHNIYDYVSNYYFYVRGLFLYEDTNGYYYQNGEDKWYVTGIEGGELDDFIKLTISPEGELVYTIGHKYVMSDQTPKPSYIVLENGNVTLNFGIVWTISDILTGPNKQARYDAWDTIYSQSVEDGYNVMRVSGLPSPEDEKMLMFAKTGETLKGEDYLILDYRFNTGGASACTSNWIEKFNKYGLQFPWCNMAYWEISSPLIDKLLNKNEAGDGKYHTYGWSCRYSKITRNDNTVFWLTDNYCGSSGDASIKQAQMYENMIVIGTQTSGCTGEGGGWMTIYLPNTGIGWTYGPSVILYDALDVNSIGFDPDIWVPSEYALELTIKMCEYYGLEPGEKKVEAYGVAPERVSIDRYETFDTENYEYVEKPKTHFNISLKIGIFECPAGETFGMKYDGNIGDVYYKGKKVTDFKVIVPDETYCTVENKNGRIIFKPKVDGASCVFYVAYNGEYSKFGVETYCDPNDPMAALGYDSTDEISLKIGNFECPAGEAFGMRYDGNIGDVYYKGEKVTDFTVIVPDETYCTVENKNGRIKFNAKTDGAYCEFYVAYNGEYSKFGVVTYYDPNNPMDTSFQ